MSIGTVDNIINRLLFQTDISSVVYQEGIPLKKRFLIALLTGCLAAALLPATAMAETVNTIPYEDWDSVLKQTVSQSCAAATVVSSSDTTWGDDGCGGWYVVNGNVTVAERIVVSGNVHLILADGSALTASKGIQVQDTDDDCTNGSPNGLTIYGQAGGTGSLTVPMLTGDDAAIGGTKGVTGACGTVTINGGIVNVNGKFGAGIGGYANINSSVGGVGYIGGAGGTITINGGTVTATSGWSAGIGGGRGDLTRHGGIITINGGFIKASSRYAASIGGGQLLTNRDTVCENGADVTISGGIIDATGYSGRSIGNGQNGYSWHVPGKTGTFTTTPNGNAVIFADSISDKSDKENWSGIIFEGSKGELYGSTVTPCGDFTVGSGKTLTIGSEKTLVNSHTIHVEGTVVNSGTVTNTGKIYVDGSFNGTADNLYYPLTLVKASIDSDILSLFKDKNYVKVGTEGIKLTYDTPEAGLRFDSWEVSPKDALSIGADSIFTMPQVNLTITALYTGKFYTVSFDSAGGSAVPDRTGLLWHDTVLGGETAPTRDTWEFTGWTYGKTSVSETTLYSDLASDDEEMKLTLTAMWKDVTAPVITGLEDNKVYCSEPTATVTDNSGLDGLTVTAAGSPVVLSSAGTFTLSASDSAQEIIITDAAGNQKKLTVTVNSGHLGGTPTCTEKASCQYCGEAYGDVDITHHVTINYESAVEATVTSAGSIEHWYCDACGRLFSDEDGKNVITAEDIVTPKLPPSIIEGTGQSVFSGEKKALSFTSNAAYADFYHVELDGKTLSADNYTVKEGSTIVTLKADCVAALAVGEHTIGIVSESGTAVTTFVVNSRAVPSPQNPQNPNSPDTGDNSCLPLWIMLLLVSAGLPTAVYRRRRSAR